MTRWTYQKAGVDIAKGEDFVKRISKITRSTRRSGAQGDIGGFGGIFDLGALAMRDPLLVAACDGVGTKVKLACQWDMHDTIGIDLVAMCVNDLIVQGAQPLFFLDYWACETLDSAMGQRIVSGIADGCRMAGCALIGGESAEMPDMYRKGEYDLAGFAVGAVERAALLDGSRVRQGDVVIGIESSGLHSNGFSLLRKVIEGMDDTAAAPFAKGTMREQWMTPTRIYVTALQRALASGKITALAHITGGGIPGNVGRVIPDGLAFSWRPTPMTAIFRWLRDHGNIAAQDMVHTFNLGIGMVVITRREDCPALRTMIEEDGYPSVEMGTIIKTERGAPRCIIDGEIC